MVNDRLLSRLSTAAAKRSICVLDSTSTIHSVMHSIRDE
jgi:hypothetical protein